MGNISATKLGGICLIVGPALATILYVVLYMILGDSGIDPAKWADVAADAAARNNLEIILLMIPPIGIILAFYGLSVLHASIKENGNNEALFGLGLTMFVVSVIATVIGWGMFQAIPWDGTDGAVIASISQGVSGYGWMIGSIGFMLVSLVVANNREGIHQILAYIVSIVSLIVVIFGIIAIADTDALQVAQIINGISYIIISIWSVTVGMDMLKKA